MNFIYSKSIVLENDIKVSDLGGKAFSLVKMSIAGFPVPDFFVVTSSAFYYFLEQNNIKEKLFSYLKDVDYHNNEVLEKVSQEILECILSKEIPKDLSDNIISSYASLKSDFVAVRSSATVEDGMEFAWAGQLETFLNVDVTELFIYIKKCWASLYSSRALYYGLKNGFSERDISMGVIIQKMINSDKSGVAFSIHPITSTHNQIYIEAGYGLGEAIVGGHITPDNYVVSKKDNLLIECRVNIQKRALRSLPIGGNEWIELLESGHIQKLSEMEIMRLSDLIIRIESYFCFPCDIEWAYQGNELYITQCRPITVKNGTNT